MGVPTERVQERKSVAITVCVLVCLFTSWFIPLLCLCSSTRPLIPPVAIGSSSLCGLAPPLVMRGQRSFTSHRWPLPSSSSSNAPTHFPVQPPGRWGGGRLARNVHWSCTATGHAAREAFSSSSSGPMTLSRDHPRRQADTTKPTLLYIHMLTSLNTWL